MQQRFPPSRTKPERLMRGQRLGSRLRALWHSYWQWRAMRATIHVLSGLDDRMLKDIGIERSEIEPIARSVAREGWRGFYGGGRQ